MSFASIARRAGARVARATRISSVVEAGTSWRFNALSTARDDDDARGPTPTSPHRHQRLVNVHDDGGVGLGVDLDYDDRGAAGAGSAAGRSAQYEEYVSSLTPRQANVVIAAGDLEKASGKYRVEVTTGRNRGAGTSGRVELTFVGGDGLTYPVALEYESGINPTFSRASSLPFRIASSARLGDLKRTRVRLVPELTSVGRGWFLEDIKVTCESTGDEWFFPCHRWFGQSDAGDGKSGPFTQDLEAKSPDEIRTPLWMEGDIRKERGEFECVASGAAVPHPEKMKREGMRALVRRTHGHGGEDAYFTARGPDNTMGMGIADGVYLWRWQGIDAGEYSRLLMNHAAEALRSGKENRPTAMLTHAYEQVTAAGMKGSTTACVVVIDSEHGLLYGSNVGDSGFMLIRGEPGARFCAHRSPPQEHDFGCPFQLGHHEASDKASDAMRTKLYLEHGDIVVLGSDGLWDNLSEVEVLESVEASVAEGASIDERLMDVAARNLLSKAYEVSMDKSRTTPYSLAATEHFDMVYSGGKKDDISVVVCHARIGNGADR
jgi:protein phosphatase PTC7